MQAIISSMNPGKMVFGFGVGGGSVGGPR